jgi:hypothetical protein
MTSARRVAQRYRQALDDSQALNLIDQWVDTFLDRFVQHADFDERAIEGVLQAHGLSAEHVNDAAGAEGKEAGNALQALGGWISHGVWGMILKPFLNIAKYFTSQEFRGGIKRSIRRYLSHEVRATRHIVEVAARLVRGQHVPPQERNAAVRQFVHVLGKVVFLYVSGPQIIHFFAGGIWSLIGGSVPLEKVLTSLIEKPLLIAAKSLLG